MVLHGWIKLPSLDTSSSRHLLGATRMLVEVRLQLRKLLKVKSSLPDTLKVLKQLDATLSGGSLWTSFAPLSPEGIERAKLGMVRRIQSNRLPVNEAAGWATGAADTEVASLLGMEPDKQHLLELQVSTCPLPCARPCHHSCLG